MNKLERDILDILTDDCRTDTSQIAVMLDTDEAEVRSAVRNMENRGIHVFTRKEFHARLMSKSTFQRSKKRHALLLRGHVSSFCHGQFRKGVTTCVI